MPLDIDIGLAKTSGKKGTLVYGEAVIECRAPQKESPFTELALGGVDLSCPGRGANLTLTCRSFLLVYSRCSSLDTKQAEMD